MHATTTRPSTPRPLITPSTPVEAIVPGLLWGQYFAPSRSDVGVYWLVDVGTRTCTCPAGQHNFERCRARACAHLIAADETHARATNPFYTAAASTVAVGQTITIRVSVRG